MDSETQERVIRHLSSIAFAGMLMIFAYLVKESLPYVTAALGLVVGSVTGGEIAARTKKQTLRKVQEESERPPPPSDDDEGGPGTTVQSEPPAPRMPRRDPPRRMAVALALLALVAVAVACAAGSSNPAPKAYGAERLLCVQMHDAAGPARDCMRDVDRRYGQDGGL